MADDPSTPARRAAREPKDVRGYALDAVDHAIVRLLVHDARMPNAAIASAVGVAPSTCLARVRALREAGVIRGYHAEIDHAALGRPLQAMIAVRLRGGARSEVRAFAHRIAEQPEVLDVYFLAGADDFLIRIAAHDTERLRAFVEQLSARREVASTQTSLIFEHIPASGRG